MAEPIRRLLNIRPAPEATVSVTNFLRFMCYLCLVLICFVACCCYFAGTSLSSLTSNIEPLAAAFPDPNTIVVVPGCNRMEPIFFVR